MIQSVALTIVLVFGIVIVAVCLFGLAAPNRLIDTVLRVWRQPGGVMTAVLIRVLLGLNLIMAAVVSRHYMAFTVLGAIALLAAIVILLAGRERVDKLVEWGLQRSPPVFRAWLLVGVAFGGFLIWGSL